MTVTTAPRQVATAPRLLLAGAEAGLAGGVVFGALMHSMGVLPMVAGLVGGEGTAVGWAVHLAISAVLGVGYALVAGRRATALPAGAVLGGFYGVAWWVLGGLLLMPAAVGMPVLTLGPMAWTSLLGHVLYGLVLGLVFAAVARRSPGR